MANSRTNGTSIDNTINNNSSLARSLGKAAGYALITLGTPLWRGIERTDNTFDKYAPAFIKRSVYGRKTII